jgi:FAD/FMN-containing dehydrogenase
MQPMDNLMQLAELRAPQVRDVRANLAGELVVPGDPSWDEARLAWHLAVDQRPEAVAIPENLHDVIEIVLWAREEGFRVAPQGTGHNAPALGDLAGTVLLKTHRMRGVAIDPVSRTARAEAGAIWIDVVKAAAEHGLAALAGSSPDVGVVGYTLGGGLSWLARKHGIGANQVTAIELVTADGEFRRVDRENEPDLFWALRGGGGAFGVVTAIEFNLFPITEVYAGHLFFPVERAGEVLRAWRDWTETVPDEITSVARILQLPPIEEIPEPLRGNSFAVLQAIYSGDDFDEARRLVDELRALGPAMDTSTSCRSRASATCTWTRRSRSPGSRTARRSPCSTTRRSTPSSRPSSARPSSLRRSAIWAARSRAHGPSTARSRRSRRRTSRSRSG